MRKFLNLAVNPLIVLVVFWIFAFIWWALSGVSISDIDVSIAIRCIPGVATIIYYGIVYSYRRSLMSEEEKEAEDYLTDNPRGQV